jgi:hypothetical protein
MKNKMLEDYIDEAMGEMGLFGFMVPSINAPGMLADPIKNIWLHYADTDTIAETPFIGVYWDVQEGRKVMLLAINNKVNVGALLAPFGGKGDATVAMIKAPSLRDIKHEGIPLAEEFPPDDTDVLVLLAPPFADGPSFWRQAHHVKDGEFNDDQADSFIAWSYLPEYEHQSTH